MLLLAPDLNNLFMIFFPYIWNYELKLLFLEA